MQRSGSTSVLGRAYGVDAVLPLLVPASSGGGDVGLLPTSSSTTAWWWRWRKNSCRTSSGARNRGMWRTRGVERRPSEAELKVCLSLPPPPHYIGGRGGWGQPQPLWGAGQGGVGGGLPFPQMRVGGGLLLPPRKVTPPPKETLGFPRWGGQPLGGLVRLA